MKYKTIRVTSGSFGNGVKSLIFHLSELTPQKAAGLTIETFSMDDDKLIFLALPKESPFANYLMDDFEEIKEIDFNSANSSLSLIPLSRLKLSPKRILSCITLFSKSSLFSNPIFLSIILNSSALGPTCLLTNLSVISKFILKNPQ